MKRVSTLEKALGFRKNCESQAVELRQELLAEAGLLVNEPVVIRYRHQDTMEDFPEVEEGAFMRRLWMIASRLEYTPSQIKTPLTQLVCENLFKGDSELRSNEREAKFLQIIDAIEELNPHSNLDLVISPIARTPRLRVVGGLKAG